MENGSSMVQRNYQRTHPEIVFGKLSDLFNVGHQKEMGGKTPEVF